MKYKKILYKILKAISNYTLGIKKIMLTFSTVIMLFCIMLFLQSCTKAKYAEAAVTEDATEAIKENATEDATEAVTENATEAVTEAITEAAVTESQNPQNSTEISPLLDVNNEEDWALILVNQWHSLPENYEVSLKQLDDDQAVDERCYSDLQQMLDDCQMAGLSPIVCSSYRTVERQEQLYNELINKLIEQGYSMEDAVNEAGQTIALPGTSEHHLGLALDIVDENYQLLDTSQEGTSVQQWMMENSWKYGFILRYPNGKSDITGITYEPWHYRYVGKTAAAEIYEMGICLEEYLGQAEHTD